jgi:L-ascorbate metabolism protein UlaG (beta-lactamase superfamily)
MNEPLLVYLKPNVVIEPLFDNWYSWPHLISPATAAMNITGRHLKILNSYIQAPQIHEAAAKNPKMRGGPFMDFPSERVDEVKKLKEQTLKEQKDLIELSNALKELDRLLQTKAKGYSLHGLYEEVPEILKGYVELVYDLNNYPSYRIYESLLYKSKYYKLSSQSIALWVTENDERPFVLSTPRLGDEDVLQLDIPFNHPIIDMMAKMKREPGKLSELKVLIDLDEEAERKFDSLFTEEIFPSYRGYDGDKIKMRYFGHACILIETKDVSILIDPLISYYGYYSDTSKFSDADLPDEIDYVLITHNHQDHILFETLLLLRHKIKNIVVPRCARGVLQDPSLKLMFKSIGFDNILELEEMESLVLPGCKITGIPFIGEHADLDVRSKLCFQVKIEDFSMLFVADSCIVEKRVYEHVRKEIGDVDVIFLGMECDGAPFTWLYGPLLTEELARDKDQSRRLSGSNYERGMNLVSTFKPKEVYVYAMGQEPWLEFISSIKYTEESNPIVASNALVKECTEKEMIAERLFGEKELLYEFKAKKE